MIVGHDQGISISSNRGEVLVPASAPHRADVSRPMWNQRIPYYVYGNRQDGPSSHGPFELPDRGLDPDRRVALGRGLRDRVRGARHGRRAHRVDRVLRRSPRPSRSGQRLYPQRLRVAAGDRELGPGRTSSIGGSGRSPSRCRRTTTTASTWEASSCTGPPTGVRAGR